MSNITYAIVEHDGGWAYKLADVFSETFPSHAEAEEAAKRVAAEQGLPGDSEAIQYQDEKGEWHEEMASGDDRPSATIEDKSS